MAKQKGIIKLGGTMGGITFYKSQDGHLAREKGGVSGSRIANDPAFKRTRENGSEFGRAGKAGKSLRTALRVLLLNSADGRMVSRLTQQMVKVIQADLINVRGQRNVIDGEAELLNGFEFNIKGKLGTSLYAPYSATIDRAAGELTLSIPSFIPNAMIVAPGGTTHYKITSAGAEVDFEAETFVSSTSATAILPWGATASTVVSQLNVVTAASVSPLFLAVGLEFYQEVNGVMYPLNNGSFNPVALVAVNGL